MAEPWVADYSHSFSDCCESQFSIMIDCKDVNHCFAVSLSIRSRILLLLLLLHVDSSMFWLCAGTHWLLFRLCVGLFFARLSFSHTQFAIQRERNCIAQMSKATVDELCAALPADNVRDFIWALRESKSQLSIDKLAQLLQRRVDGLQLDVTKTEGGVFAGMRAELRQ